MTPKQKVLKKWPKAYCVDGWFSGPSRWHVWMNNKLSGRGSTAAKAWAEAARRVK